MGKRISRKLTEQLRAAVTSSGMSLGELARETGIDKSALSRFVNRDRGLSMEGVDAIGECLSLRIVVDKSKARKGK